jgi:hypothetical protein
MMWPFCVRGHVDIRSNALVASITIDARKLHPNCPCYLWQPIMDSVAIRLLIENEFNHHKINDRIFNFLIT